MDALAEIGAEIGSDVSFVYTEGRHCNRARREIISILRHLQACWVILAKPEIGVSTAEVYRNLKIEEMDSS